MLGSRGIFGWSNARGQIVAATLVTGLAGLFAMFKAVHAFALLFLIVVCSPGLLALLFIGFSYFRLHEAYTFLIPLKPALVIGGAALISLLIAALKKATVARQKRTQWLGLAALFTSAAFAIFATIDSVSWQDTPTDRLIAFAGLSFAALAMFSWCCVLQEVEGVPWGPEIKLFIAFFALTSIGVAFAANLKLSMLFWIATYWKIGAMTLAIGWLTRSRRDFLTAVWVLVLSGCLISLVAFFNSYNGIDLVEGTRVTIGRTLFSTPDDIENAIPGLPIPGGSLLGDPNDLALVLLTPLGFALAMVVKRGRRSVLGRLCFIAVPMLVLAIILTKSRGGAIGILAVFGVVGLSYVRSRVVLGLLGAVAALGLFVTMDIANRQSGGLAEISRSGIDDSALHRFYAWSAATSMAATHPLTGVGVNNFVNQFRQHTPVWPGKKMAVHSTWFGVLGETGFPGLIVFLSLIYFTWLAALRAQRRLHDARDGPEMEAIALALSAGLAGFCASGTFLTQGFTWPLYILVGLTAALSRYTYRLTAEQRDELPATRAMAARALA